MKPGHSTWFLIAVFCGVGAFAVYHAWNSGGPHPAHPTDMARSSGSNPQDETSPATGLAHDVNATRTGDIESNTSRGEAPSPSLKEVERMRKLAIAHGTPARQYISELFDAKNPRANIAAAVLHGELSKGKPDPAWSTASEQTLRDEMAQLPSRFSSRLEFSQVKCGPSLCEIQAAVRFTSPYQSSQDILDWQTYVREMLRSPSSRADQLTDPVTILSTTPDDRPLFLVYVRRGQGSGSNGARD